MSEQPNALRLADALEMDTFLLTHDRYSTAAELRRLHAEVERLQALAQPKAEQEPVAWWDGKESVVFSHDEILTPNWTDYWTRPLYTHPQPKAEQEPVAWIHEDKKIGYKALEWKENVLGYCGVWKKIPLYTHPQPKREWVGLTDEDMNDPKTHNFDFIDGARWAEAKLKEKNHEWLA